jgi:hypothetical protein
MKPVIAVSAVLSKIARSSKPTPRASFLLICLIVAYNQIANAGMPNGDSPNAGKKASISVPRQA